MLQALQSIKINAFIRTHYTERKSARKKQAVLHWHDYYQLVYVRRGNGAIIIGDMAYPLSCGDALLIRPNEPHKFSCTEKMETYEVKFTFPEDRADPLLRGRRCFCRDATGDIKRTLRQIEVESDDSDPFSRALATLSLARVLLLMCREVADTGEPFRDAPKESTDIFLEQINAYIDENLSKRFAVRDMAAHFYTEYTHFSRMFSAKYGIRLQQYINQQRIAQAKELLTATNMSITEISQKCGFENLSNLERNFKRIVGISPTKYRGFFQNVRVVTFENYSEIHPYIKADDK